MAAATLEAALRRPENPRAQSRSEAKAAKGHAFVNDRRLDQASGAQKRAVTFGQRHLPATTRAASFPRVGRGAGGLGGADFSAQRAIENSPAIHRWVGRRTWGKSRQGRQNCVMWRGRLGEFLSSLTGLASLPAFKPSDKSLGYFLPPSRAAVPCSTTHRATRERIRRPFHFRSRTSLAEILKNFSRATRGKGKRIKESKNKG